MRTLSRLVAIAATYLLASGAALAMDIQQFERMVEADQHAYVTDLVWGAAILLEQECTPEPAAQLRKLFLHELGAGKTDPLEGTQALGDRLLLAGRRAAEHPEQAPSIRVDDLLRATLRDKGITLPDRFADVDRAFTPKAAALAEKPDDDGGFGSRARADGLLGDIHSTYAIQFLQYAFDERNYSEITAGKSLRGVCNEAQTLLKQGATLQESGKPVEAAAAFRSACDKGSALGCGALGEMYDKGTGVAKDAFRAASLYQEACDGGLALACNNLALDFANGVGVAKDLTRSAALYKQACDGGVAEACSKVSAKAGAPAPLPAGVQSVADYQPSWIGRMMTVRGTVSRFVRKDVNGEPYVYLWFKERPDSTVVACSRDDYWLLGVLNVDDFEAVVGKTFEFTGEIVKGPCAEQGASLWIWQRNMARLVGGATR